MDLLGYLW